MLDNEQARILHEHSRHSKSTVQKRTVSCKDRSSDLISLANYTGVKFEVERFFYLSQTFLTSIRSFISDSGLAKNEVKCSLAFVKRF